MEDNKIKVYVKLDSNNCIISINSSVFLQDTNGWIEIDEGHGDKYSHAQGNYLDKGIMDMKGRYNYKWMDNKVIELTEDEKKTLFQPIAPQPTELEILENQLLETQNMIIEFKYSHILQ